MGRYYRKTTPRVVGGKVQRKNRSAETPSFYNTPQDMPRIIREKPGRGYRHVLRKSDVVDFVSIVPQWDELSRGLNAVVLAPGDEECMGWHASGVVRVCAWERDLWKEWATWFYEEHCDILERMSVPCERIDSQAHLCKFTEATVRAFQLLHILLHELGHHHDRMTTK